MVFSSLHKSLWNRERDFGNLALKRRPALAIRKIKFSELGLVRIFSELFIKDAILLISQANAPHAIGTVTAVEQKPGVPTVFAVRRAFYVVTGVTVYALHTQLAFVNEIRVEALDTLREIAAVTAAFISAQRGTGLTALMRSVTHAHKAAFAKLPTPKLTRALIAAVERQAPPRSGRGRPKMRYAHQGGRNPPIVVIHGSALTAIGDSYRRFLEGWFRDRFELAGTPLRIEFRTGANPYVTDREKR